MSLEEVAHEDAPEPMTAMTSPEMPYQSRKRKWLGLKRGERELNQFPNDTYVITDMASQGSSRFPRLTWREHVSLGKGRQVHAAKGEGHLECWPQ